MPLSETNKKESQSIEDLIAQLDSPTAALANAKNAVANAAAPASALNCNNENENASNSRRLLKGRRTVSCSSSGPAPNSAPITTAAPTAASFVKTNSFGQSSEPILSKNILASKKYTKHTRSTLRDRGAPKKGGGGGKHTWGAPGCELNDDAYLDANDPNYDSDDGHNVVMVCVENRKANSLQQSGEEGETANNSNLKELDEEALEEELKPVILEYFQNGDTIEVIDHLKCYNFTRIKSALVAFLVQVALEHNNTCKELTSRLLRDLTVELLAEKDFVRGFDRLLANLTDLTLDNPDAAEKSGTFIARAIADKVLAKSYLDRFEVSPDGTAVAGAIAADPKVQAAVESARLLVNINDHLFQLAHIWGHKGGFLAVRELTDKINELIQEYNDSGDIDEAMRCLKELNVPHFHHEFIYEAIDFSLQKGDDHAIELIANLLDRLCRSVIVTYDQLKMGFKRLFDLLPDISLDVPNANALMDKIMNKCHAKGFVSEDIMDLAPNRSRKRFVSEGDGGRFKEANGLY